MRVIQGQAFDHLQLPGCVLTIGNFDGVHGGHQQIIAQAGLLATNRQVPVVVLTFEPHPLSRVGPRRSPPRLTPPDEKTTQLGLAGADLVVVAEAGTALLELEPETFIDEIILPRFRPSHIVEGVSFRFGRERRGTTTLLRQMGESHGFDVFVVEPVRLQVEGGETVLVSSSLIRRLLLEGKVHRARLCLGRPYTLVGRVSTGARRGAGLGFPTVNVESRDQLIPAEGVYSGEAHVEGHSYPAAISVGSAPTFAGAQVRVEAHLLGFSGDVYGRPIRLAFHYPLREQKKFASRDELIEQIEQDVASVQRWYGARAVQPPEAGATR